jgi:hypothetical protein
MVISVILKVPVGPSGFAIAELDRGRKWEEATWQGLGHKDAHKRTVPRWSVEEA